ncbi:hypothetical protein AURANDRAFT_69579, partial [Aureococcus anophagefferens]
MSHLCVTSRCDLHGFIILRVKQVVIVIVQFWYGRIITLHVFHQTLSRAVVGRVASIILAAGGSFDYELHVLDNAKAWEHFSASDLHSLQVHSAGMVQLRRLEVVGLVDRVDDEDTRKLAKGMLEVAPNFQVDHAALWWVPVESIEAVVIAAHTHDVAYGDLWWLNGVKRVVVCGKQITESGKEKSIDVEGFD